MSRAGPQYRSKIAPQLHPLLPMPSYLHAQLSAHIIISPPAPSARPCPCPCRRSSPWGCMPQHCTTWPHTAQQPRTARQCHTARASAAGCRRRSGRGSHAGGTHWSSLPPYLTGGSHAAATTSSRGDNTRHHIPLECTQSKVFTPTNTVASTSALSRQATRTLAMHWAHSPLHMGSRAAAKRLSILR